LAAAVAAAAAVAELGLRLQRFGVTRDLFGRWSSPPPWEQLRTFDAAGDPLPLSGGEGTWAIAPGEPAIRYRLNGLGLREERELPPEAAPGTCRILALGDAYTFGYAVEAARAYPRLLERRLARVRPVEVVNAGFPNLDVEQQERRLRRLLPRLKPDVVVAGFDWWNVPAPLPPRPAKWSAGWLARNLEQEVGRVARHLGIVQVGFTLARHALTPVFFAPSGLAREMEALALPPEALAERWDRTRAALRAMASGARDAGARFVLVVMPLDVQLDSRRNALYRRGALPYAAHGFVDRDYTRAVAMPRALARFAREEGIERLDLTAALRAAGGAALFLPRDYHVSAAGQRVIARELAHWVRKSAACGAS
jgi:lysophospholipase L1-like esterase